MGVLKRLGNIILSLLLLAVPFFVLSSHLKDPSKINALDEAVLGITEPLQNSSAAMARSASGFFQEINASFRATKENERLRLENQRLRAKLRRLESVQSRNQKMHSLLELRKKLPEQTMSANVIAKDSSAYFRVARIRLDRGGSDAVKVDMPVIAYDGVVGRIRRVGKSTADVLLAVDRESSIEVIIPRIGARGALVGMGETDSYRSRIERLQKSDDIQVGDAVYTSGFGKHFPASILIGYVSKVEESDGNLEQKVVVTPSVNFSSLREVLIVINEEKAGASN